MQRISVAFLALALWLISGAASANLVLNGGFETGDFTFWTQSGNEGFTFVDGTPHSGNYAAWLGPEGSLGFLSQQLSTVTGAQYDLDFWLRHEPFGTGVPNEFEVLWAGNPVTIPGLATTNLGSFPYTEYNVILPAAAAASTELTFGFREDTDYFQLDDVSVQPVPAPKLGTGPSSVIVLGFGLMALLARRHKFKKRTMRNRRFPTANERNEQERFMKFLKHGSAWIAGVVTLLFSQAMALSVAHAACPITDFSPDGIQTSLKTNNIKTAAGFVACLPDEYKVNWIMMSFSQSAQSGTAEFPRFILTSKDSTKVFGLELPSNPNAAASNTIEYFQFEPTAKDNKYHFHSIVTDEQMVIANDKSCQTCHSPNPRPNWDAYDSWGGMLPFNRDRVYQFAQVDGKMEESVESKAIKRIVKALKANGDALFAQLKLPKGISQNATTGDVTIKFTAPCDEACFSDPGAGGGLVPVKYGLDKDGHVIYPGDKETDVKQGGKFLRLNSPSKKESVTLDEGRGVALFDNFTSQFIAPGVEMDRLPGPNPRRIAQSILDYVKDTAVVDVRYVALGIVKGCITVDTLGKFAPKPAEPEPKRG